jgi:hypothetical protein
MSLTGDSLNDLGKNKPPWIRSATDRPALEAQRQLRFQIGRSTVNEGRPGDNQGNPLAYGTGQAAQLPDPRTRVSNCIQISCTTVCSPGTPAQICTESNVNDITH